MHFIRSIPHSGSLADPAERARLYALVREGFMAVGSNGPTSFIVTKGKRGYALIARGQGGVRVRHALSPYALLHGTPAERVRAWRYALRAPCPTCRRPL